MTLPGPTSLKKRYPFSLLRSMLRNASRARSTSGGDLKYMESSIVNAADSVGPIASETQNDRAFFKMIIPVATRCHGCRFFSEVCRQTRILFRLFEGG